MEPVSESDAAAPRYAGSLSFCAHQDDDLLFMNPDIASDIQAGQQVWVVYLTAGEVPPGNIEYANKRIDGERAAYARAAKVPNNWVFEPMVFAGHEIATNRLTGTGVRLLFTYIHAADGAHNDPCGDLFRLINQPGFRAQPIDGRPAYDRASFTAMLRAIIETAKPGHIRTQSTLGHRQGDHVDHVAGAILAADANTDAAGKTLIRRDEYQGYMIRDRPDNVSGYWRDEKQAIWDQYWPHDPELQPGAWYDVMGKQYRPEDRIFHPGHPWVAPTDFTNC
ncbi:hypothetical protein D5S17_15820 [Pseudonocardiaceae bacterium YIM PH 21723]|nr:hypothetical protein D5S17_15820 [Pseudonocardiaceae bacterium YIM PH 21723]